MVAFNRKERDRYIRREDILNAAGELFALKGYHGTTIRDIAKEAQYATGTVYLEFPDKETLYVEMFKSKFQRLLSMLKTRIPGGAKARVKLRFFIEYNMDYFVRNRNFFRLLTSEDGFFLEAGLFKNSMGKPYTEYAASLIKQAQEEGIVGREFKQKDITEMFLAILVTFMINMVKSNKQISDKEEASLCDTIYKFLLLGSKNK